VLLKATDGSLVYAPILLALATGLRKGEVFGLKWSDLDGESLHVSRTLSQTAQGVELKTPKTKKSNRTIALPQFSVDLLRRHRAEQSKTKLAMGSGYRDKGLIFARPDGSPWKTTSFDGMFARFVRNAELWKLRPELKRFRFHDLRHTQATQLLKAGENIKVVSERLGHASITITLDTYAHVLPNMQAEAAGKCDALTREVIG
jgi:integrase